MHDIDCDCEKCLATIEKKIKAKRRKKANIR
jgi:hypothetical protein